MRIAVDAMGGDFGPRVTVPGAVKAAQELDVDILLVGVETPVRRELERLETPGRAGDHRRRARRRSAWARASSPSGRRKPRRSASAPSSSRTAGPTPSSPWATRPPSSTSRRKVLGALKGVDKPALALLLPTARRRDPAPRRRGQRQLPAARTWSSSRSWARSSWSRSWAAATRAIGLMSIGEEQAKGNDLAKEAFERLQAAPI